MAIPNITLKTIDFKPSIRFTPTEYKSSRPDATILPKSLQTQEARETQARTNKTAITEKFSELRPDLDKSELSWLDAEEDRINNNIKTQIDLGNTESAIRMAQEEADNLAGNKSLQYKVLANKQRQEWLKGINSQTRSALSKRYIEALNPYYDDGTGTWKPQFAPEYEVDIVGLQQLAANLTPVRSKSNQKEGDNNIFVDSDGNTVNVNNLNPAQLVSKMLTGDANLFGAGTTSKYDSYSMKTSEDMRKLFTDILSEGKIARALHFKFNEQLWGYQEAERLLNDPNLTEAQRIQAQSDIDEFDKLMKDENGIRYTPSQYEKWLQDKVVSAFVHMEYKNTQHSESSHMGYNVGTKKGNDGKTAEEYLQQYFPIDSGGTKGFNIVNTESYTEEKENIEDYNKIYKQ